MSRVFWSAKLRSQLPGHQGEARSLTAESEEDLDRALPADWASLLRSERSKAHLSTLRPNRGGILSRSQTQQTPSQRNSSTMAQYPPVHAPSVQARKSRSSLRQSGRNWETPKKRQAQSGILLPCPTPTSGTSVSPCQSSNRLPPKRSSKNKPCRRQTPRHHPLQQCLTTPRRRKPSGFLHGRSPAGLLPRGHRRDRKRTPRLLSWGHRRDRERTPHLLSWGHRLGRKIRSAGPLISECWLYWRHPRDLVDAFPAEGCRDEIGQKFCCSALFLC